MDANLEETGNNRFDPFVDFGDCFVVSGAVDLSNLWLIAFAKAKGFEETLGSLNDFFTIGGSIIWDDNEERFVHNISFLRKYIDKVDVIVH